jgi:hypothetical protein
MNTLAHGFPGGTPGVWLALSWLATMALAIVGALIALMACTKQTHRHIVASLSRLTLWLTLVALVLIASWMASSRGELPPGDSDFVLALTSMNGGLAGAAYVLMRFARSRRWHQPP